MLSRMVELYLSIKILLPHPCFDYGVTSNNLTFHYVSETLLPLWSLFETWQFCISTKPYVSKLHVLAVMFAPWFLGAHSTFLYLFHPFRLLLVMQKRFQPHYMFEPFILEAMYHYHQVYYILIYIWGNQAMVSSRFCIAVGSTEALGSCESSRRWHVLIASDFTSNALGWNKNFSPFAMVLWHAGHAFIEKGRAWDLWGPLFEEIENNLGSDNPKWDIVWEELLNPRQMS